LTVEKIFEPRQALSLLEQAMTRLRQEYLAREKGLQGVCRHHKNFSLFP